MFGIRRNKLRSDRGSILLVVLAVLAVLAVTISGILMFGGWQRTQGFLYLEETRVRSLAESGIHDALAELAANPGTKNLSRHVALDSANQISYTIRPWGAYLQIQSTGLGRRARRTLVALVGAPPPRTFDHALTPLGAPYPLVVSGRTQILGNVFVGPGGLTRGEINGRGFEGDQLISGRVDTIGMNLLPRFSDSLLNEFLNSLNELREATNANDLSLAYRDSREVAAAFATKESAVRTRASIEFNGSDSLPMSIRCHFFADQSIRVMGRSHLRDLVLCAREVIISDESYLGDCIIVADQVRLTDDAIVNGQIIVRDTLHIESRAALGHQSLVLLLGRKVEDRVVGVVDVTTLSPVRAIVVNGASRPASSATVREASACRLHVSPQSRIEGLVWWEGLVELKGTIAGAAAVNLFTHYSPPTTYMNWLVDARVEFDDVTKLDAFPLIFSKAERPKLHTMREMRTR